MHTIHPPSYHASHLLRTVCACLQAFLDESEVRSSAAAIKAAALAVAGAVENNRCPMTNISWVIDGKQLQQRFNFQVAVLNDFEAVGYGIPALGAGDLVPLTDAPMSPEAPKVVMGECRAQVQLAERDGFCEVQLREVQLALAAQAVAFPCCGCGRGMHPETMASS